MMVNQELKNGKWVEAEPLKFKPCCIADCIWLIKCKFRKIIKKVGAK